eukprot:TRINITY_DN67186_c0_g1_i1.p1 TRINITY_DN67186_c0_g1~~TRINITY_DN67186_c0_g1_i1.p1  ORF type:complete len:111 (+),score=3.99 TRINITY_DN67186_c0_g1_i1:493-825(+)
MDFFCLFSHCCMHHGPNKAIPSGPCQEHTHRLLAVVLTSTNPREITDSTTLITCIFLEVCDAPTPHHHWCFVLSRSALAPRFPVPCYEIISPASGMYRFVGGHWVEAKVQ